MSLEIINSVGEKLDCELARGRKDCHRDNLLVVLGHGVTGNKDRPLLKAVAAAINECGVDTLRFSFAGNGKSQGDFRESTISKEVNDLGAVLDAVAKDKVVIYIGHSMGNAVGVMRAADDPRIRGLVSLAGMVDTRKFAETEFGSLTPDRDFMWEDGDCPLSSAFMEDLCKTVEDVARFAEKVTVPWLLIHGTADDVVLPDDSRKIRQLKGEAVELIEIEGGDHLLSEVSQTQKATEAVVQWLSREFLQ